MNGFEPLRRRIIDYTDAGQWFEVYDGPIESCETEQLKTENAKLRELIADLWEYIYIGTARDGQSLHDRTRELGVGDDR